MTTTTPLLEIARTTLRYLSPVELQLLRDELDVALAATANTGAWEEWDALAAEPEVQTPPVIDPVELVSAMRR